MSKVVERLTFEAYTAGAIETDLGTRVIDWETHPITYPILGYANELGEFKEKYMFPDDWAESAGLSGEFGDLTWYFCVSLERMKISPSWALLNVLNNPHCAKPDEFGEYRYIETFHDAHIDFMGFYLQIAPLGQSDALRVLSIGGDKALALSDIYASKALGILKKLHRGDSGSGTPDREKLRAIALNLAASYAHLAAVAVMAGVGIEAAALDNLTELKGRRDRDTIKGDGDKR